MPQATKENETVEPVEEKTTEAMFISMDSQSLRIVFQPQTIDKESGKYNDDGIALQFRHGIGTLDVKQPLRGGKSAILTALKHSSYGKLFWAHPDDPNKFWEQHLKNYPRDMLFKYEKSNDGAEAARQMEINAKRERLLSSGSTFSMGPEMGTGRPVVPVKSDGRVMVTDDQMTDDELYEIGKEHLVDARKAGEWP